MTARPGPWRRRRSARAGVASCASAKAAGRPCKLPPPTPGTSGAARKVARSDTTRASRQAQQQRHDVALLQADARLLPADPQLSPRDQVVNVLDRQVIGIGPMLRLWERFGPVAQQRGNRDRAV